MQPLLAIGLEKVSTHLQVSAQVAHSVAQTIPTLSMPGDGSGAATGAQRKQVSNSRIFNSGEFSNLCPQLWLCRVYTR